MSKSPFRLLHTNCQQTKKEQTNPKQQRCITLALLSSIKRNRPHKHAGTKTSKIKCQSTFLQAEPPKEILNQLLTSLQFFIQVHIINGPSYHISVTLPTSTHLRARNANPIKPITLTHVQPATIYTHHEEQQEY